MSLGIINVVRDFNVPNDMTPGASAAMQLAINAAALNYGGGQLLCPPGEYNVDLNIVHRSNTHIIGAGDGLTIFRKTNDNSGFVCQDIEAASIRHLTIDGNYAGGGTGNGVRIGSAKQLTLEECGFTNFDSNVVEGLGDIREMKAIRPRFKGCKDRSLFDIHNKSYGANSNTYNCVILEPFCEEWIGADGAAIINLRGGFWHVIGGKLGGYFTSAAQGLCLNSGLEADINGLGAVESMVDGTIVENHPFEADGVTPRARAGNAVVQNNGRNKINIIAKHCKSGLSQAFSNCNDSDIDVLAIDCDNGAQLAGINNNVRVIAKDCDVAVRCSSSATRNRIKGGSTGSTTSAVVVETGATGNVFDFEPGVGDADFLQDSGTGTVWNVPASCFIAQPAGGALTFLDNGKGFSNEGASAQAVFNLPAAKKGLRFSFYCQDADGIKAVAAVGDTIRLAASVSGTAGNVASTAIGSSITLEAINATEWVARSSIGTWIVT